LAPIFVTRRDVDLANRKDHEADVVCVQGSAKTSLRVEFGPSSILKKTQESLAEEEAPNRAPRQRVKPAL